VCVRATNVSQRLTFFDSNKDRCVDCPSTSGILGWAAAAVGSVVAVALLVHLLSPRLSRGCRRCANLLLHQITFYVYSLAAVPKLKLIFACYQVTVALPDTYDVEMPQDYHKWLYWLDWFQLDWSVIVAGACGARRYEDRLLLRGLAPLLLLVALVVFGAWPFVFSHVRARTFNPRAVSSRDTSVVLKPFWEGMKASLLSCLPSVLPVSFFLCQGVSAGIFSAWDCTEFTLDSATDTTKSFLRDDLSVECRTSRHAHIQGVGMVLLAIWPVGMPLMYLLLLWLCRDSIVGGWMSTPLTRATSFLHQEYNQNLFWWEPLFVAERLTVRTSSLSLIVAPVSLSDC